MRFKDRIAAEEKAAKALIAKGEDNLTDEEFDELKGHFAEIKKLREQAELFKDATDELDTMAAASKQKSADKPARTMGEFVVGEVKGAGMSFAQAKAVGFETPEFKAAGDPQLTTDTGTDDIGYAPYLEQVDTAVHAHQRPLTILSLIGSGTMSGQVLKYPVYGKLEHDTLMTAEGKTITKSHLPAPEWVADKIGKAAVMWDVSEEMMEDLPYVVSDINEMNDYAMSLEEEDQVLNGDGTGDNVKGIMLRIPSDSAVASDDERTVPDRIFHAKMMVFTNTGFQADGLVINPDDYEVLRTMKNADGDYYGGGFFLPAYEGTGVMYVGNTPWGLPTVVTPAVAAGECLVGAFRMSIKFLAKGGRKFKTTNSDASKFAQDMTTNKLTQRFGLQMKYPYGVVKVSTEAASGSTGATGETGETDDSGATGQSVQAAAAKSSRSK